MAKTKIRPQKEIYENYWKMTAAWTDIFGTKFNNCLKLTIHFIDDHIKEIEELKHDVKNFRESTLYADLQTKIVSAMKWRGKDPKVNARKGINQLVKLGFINPFLSNYSPLAKQFVLTSDKKKKKIIFSKLFYQNSDFSASITKEKCKSQQIEFLLKTLNYNKDLSKEDIVALMVTDVTAYKKGYLTKNELKEQYSFCKEDKFEERKYNQIEHLMNLLKKFVQVTYNKETQKFYFADDPEAQKYKKKKEIDPIRLRIHKQELENESISLYGKKICYLLRKSYKGLVDSHIKPKALCLKEGNEDEAYDLNNALWLAPQVDTYFNCFEISFDEEGRVLLGKNIPTEISVEFQDKNLDGKVMNEYRKRYLEYHRKRFMEKNEN